MSITFEKMVNTLNGTSSAWGLSGDLSALQQGMTDLLKWKENTTKRLDQLEKAMADWQKQAPVATVTKGV